MNNQRHSLNLEMKPAVRKYAQVWGMVLLSAIILASLVVRVIMYLKTRSLWLDEAMLAESIVTRSFGSLTTEPLANTQTAPVLYLYVVKIFGLLFGHTEGALRFFSLIMLAGLLFVEFLLLTKAYCVSRITTLFALALTATVPLYMRYSNELKPYMGDAFFVILVLFTYHSYMRGKLKLPLLAGVYCVTLLFSSPALFFIASVFIVEFFNALIQKDGKCVIKTMAAGIVVLACFVVYYLLWLRPVATADIMVDYWKNNRFSFFAMSKEQIKNNVKIIYYMMGKRNCLYLPFACIGFLFALLKKDKISIVVGFSALLLLVASNLEKYPIVDRLYLFFPVLNIIYMAFCFDMLKTIQLNDIKIPVKYGIPPLALIFVALNLNFIGFAGNSLYLKTEEANPLIEYVQNTIKDDEYLYSYVHANFVLKFRNGYDTSRIGDVSQDNIIYGQRIWMDDPFWENISFEFDEDLNRIVNAKKCYLLLYHHSPERTERFITQLRMLGNLEEVLSVHDTQLYYFTAE
jgi:hypothetical protein